MAKPKRKDSLVKARFSPMQRTLIPEGSLERPALPMMKTDGKGGQPKLPSGKPGGGPPIPPPPPSPESPLGRGLPVSRSAGIKLRPVPGPTPVPGPQLIRTVQQITGVPNEELRLDPSLSPEAQEGLRIANNLAYKIQQTGVPLSDKEMAEIERLAAVGALGTQPVKGAKTASGTEGAEIVLFLRDQQNKLSKAAFLPKPPTIGPKTPSMEEQLVELQFKKVEGDIAGQEALLQTEKLKQKGLEAELAPGRFNLSGAFKTLTDTFQGQRARGAPFDATEAYNAAQAVLFPEGMDFTEKERATGQAIFNQSLIGYAQAAEIEASERAAEVAAKLEANQKSRDLIESEFNAELAKKDSNLERLISLRAEIARLGGGSQDFLVQESRRFAILQGLFSSPGRMVFASVSGLAQELSAALGGGVEIPDFREQRAKFKPSNFEEVLRLPPTQRDIELAFLFGEQGFETSEEAIAFAAQHLPAGVGPRTRYATAR